MRRERKPASLFPMPVSCQRETDFLFQVYSPLFSGSFSFSTPKEACHAKLLPPHFSFQKDIYISRQRAEESFFRQERQEIVGSSPLPFIEYLHKKGVHRGRAVVGLTAMALPPAPCPCFQWQEAFIGHVFPFSPHHHCHHIISPFSLPAIDAFFQAHVYILQKGFVGRVFPFSNAFSGRQ